MPRFSESLTMPEPRKFGAFDRDADLEVRHRDLPHWFQAGVATFITFRTIDSMPRNVVSGWHADIKRWLKENGIHCDPERLPEANALPMRLRNEYSKVRDRGWQERLDECHGECVLKRTECAKIVADALRHFDGDRYDLASFIVMPNHVHLIAQFRRGFSLSRQSESWLRFSATRINRLLNRAGAFWQAEPFDHIIRSEAQFWYLMNYIRDNPGNAGVKMDDVAYYNVFE